MLRFLWFFLAFLLVFFINTERLAYAVEYQDIHKEYKFRYHQKDYKVLKRVAQECLSPSGYKDDPLWGVVVTKVSGIKVLPTLRSANNAVGCYRRRVRKSEMEILVDCDYSKGETEGSVEFYYKHPKNLYKKVYVKMKATCVPLTLAEIEVQKKHEESLEAYRVKKKLDEQAAIKNAEKRRLTEKAKKSAAAARLAEKEKKKKNTVNLRPISESRRH